MLRSNLHRRIPAFFSSILAASLLAPAASANPILSETFSAGDRLVQDLPNTAAWYVTSGSSGSMPSSVDNPEGILTIGMGENAQILAYFTDGAPISLAVGEFLEISFSFQMTNAASQGVGVRTAVMDSSGGERVGDSSGTNIGEFNGYTGYGGWFNPGGSPTTIRERDPAENALLSSAGVWATQETRSGTITILNDNVYIGSYLIERTVDSVDVTFGLSGPNFTDFTFTHNDVGSTLTSFDTFGIWLNTNAGDAFSLTGVDVTYVPEPSTFALVFGIAAGALLLIRRRRA